MRILLTNDDGMDAKGIEALIAELSPVHEVIIAAPDKEQSGMSHAITVGTRISAEHDTAMEARFPVTAFRIGGTPADCVKLYLEWLIEGGDMPDCVLSGINRGANLGTDVLYSGTVHAAMEAFLHGLPSLAVSLDKRSEISYQEAAQFVHQHFLQKKFWAEEQPCFLNVNFPRAYRNGQAQMRLTRLGSRNYSNDFQREVAKDGKVWYRMAGEIVDETHGIDYDIAAVKAGEISVTPLQTDLTDVALWEKFHQQSAADFSLSMKL